MTMPEMPALRAVGLRVFGALPRPIRHRIVRAVSPTFTGGAVVAMTDPEGRVLLVRHSYAAGWGLPGGLLDRDERPAATARRELTEELGIDTVIGEYPVAVMSPNRPHVNFVFRAALDGDAATAVRPRSVEIIDVGWHSPTALPSLLEYTDLLLEAVGILSEGPPER